MDTLDTVYSLAVQLSLDDRNELMRKLGNFAVLKRCQLSAELPTDHPNWRFDFEKLPPIEKQLKGPADLFAQRALEMDLSWMNEQIRYRLTVGTYNATVLWARQVRPDRGANNEQQPLRAAWFVLRFGIRDCHLFLAHTDYTVSM